MSCIYKEDLDPFVNEYFRYRFLIRMGVELESTVFYKRNVRAIR